MIHRTPSDIALLISCASGRGEKWSQQFDLESKRDLAYFRLVGPGDSWPEIVTRAVRSGAKIVAIAGGDGSLRRAVPTLIATDMPLAIIPTGTGNALARELGIDLNPDLAWAALSGDLEVRAIDIGSANGELFLTVASVGLTSSIADELTRLPKPILGSAAYVPAVLSAMVSSTPFSVEVEVGDRVFKGPAHQVIAGVGSVQGGVLSLIEGASRDDGLIHVAVIEGGGIGSVGALSAGLAGRVLGLQNPIWTASAARVLMTVERNRTFILDGDEFPWMSVEFMALPAGLKVVIPRP